MKKGELIFVNITLGLIFAFLFIVMIQFCKYLDTGIAIEEQKQKKCNHEYVISSEYNFLLHAYKPVSKCTKCGKTI